MKTNNRKEELVLNDLFKKACIVLDAEGREPYKFETHKWGPRYKSGPSSIEIQPTYKLHKDNFLKFVTELERLAKTEDETPQVPSVDLLNKLFKSKHLMVAYLKKRNQFAGDYDDFKEAYKEALDVIIRPVDGRLFFDAQFYPGTGAERDLYGRFIVAFKKMHWAKRLNTQGPKSGTQSVPEDMLRLADRMRRKGKGKKSGSLETITGTLLMKMGFIKDTPEWERRHDSLYKTLCRHFKDIGI